MRKEVGGMKFSIETRGIGQIILILRVRKEEASESVADIRRKSVPYRDFELFRHRDAAESPFPVHGSARKRGEDRLLAEGSAAFARSLQNTVPLSGKCDFSYKEPAIHASRGCKHRSTGMNFRRLLSDGMKTLPARDICRQNNMTYLQSHPLFFRRLREREKKKEGGKKG